MDHHAFRVDIDHILRDKSPKYYNKIPKFLINYLKRTVHQEDINGILERNRGLEGVDFMRALVDKEFKLTLHTRGEENIPDEGRFIFASNHPLGGLDGICLSTILGERYHGKIQYLVNEKNLTLEGAKQVLSAKKDEVGRHQEIMERLQRVKAELKGLSKALGE